MNNRCVKQVCTLRFRNCGFAETHSLNSRISKVYAVTETLIAVMFPRLRNSTDNRLSAGFLARLYLLIRIDHLQGFQRFFLREGTLFTGKFGIGRDKISSVNKTQPGIHH